MVAGTSCLLVGKDLPDAAGRSGLMMVQPPRRFGPSPTGAGYAWSAPRERIGHLYVYKEHEHA